jgi:antitoxin HigA-1
MIYVYRLETSLKHSRATAKDNIVFESMINGASASFGILMAQLKLRSWTIIKGNMMRMIPPVTPGEMLDEEFLKPLGLTKYRLAKDIGVPAQRIGDIVAGKRAITADTDLRLCRYFGLSDGWWLRGQVNYDTAMARETMGETLAKIQPCALLAA